MDINPEQIKTLEDFDKATAPITKPAEPSIWPFIIWFSIFPPYGIYYAWKEKMLANIFPLFVTLTSLLLLSLLAPAPQIDKLTQSLGAKAVSLSSETQIPLVISFIIAIVGVICGLFFRHKVKKTGVLSKSGWVLLSFIFLIELILITMVTITIYNHLAPIYSLTSELQ